MLPDKVRRLDVDIGGRPSGQLLKHAVYEYRYLQPERPQEPSVALLMPPSRPTYQDGDLFAPMDQNLPEGDLFLRLRATFPRQPLTAMHLLALIGTNGIGRLGYRLPDTPPAAPPPPLDRAALRATRYTPEVFDELVRAYLSTGAGVAGVQPKILVPDRPSIPIPTLIVKATSPSYPGLTANEYLCLSAARRAGIEVPGFELSDDGQMLLVDRFDIEPGGTRLGFEDVAALMGLRVRDVHSDRKYHGSYQRIAELLQLLQLGSRDLERLFEQVAFTVMVRNGDGHLKNFGVLYRDSGPAWLAPMFDVVTTAVYRYTRYEGGPELEDRTLALKLFAGKGRSRAYPTVEELHRFGTKVCGVSKPADTLRRIAQAMSETLQAAAGDDRVPATLRGEMHRVWEDGLAYAAAA
jgi:serine/threonine-protein kinase HipA